MKIASRIARWQDNVKGKPVYTLELFFLALSTTDKVSGEKTDYTECNANGVDCIFKGERNRVWLEAKTFFPQKMCVLNPPLNMKQEIIFSFKNGKNKNEQNKSEFLL